MGLMKDLDGLNAAYASMQEGSGPMLLTKADKAGNTPAWRNRHKKNVKSGEPIYKMADHLKDEYESELWDTVAANLTELHHLNDEGTQWKVVPLNEKQKDTPDQVKAVIAYDKARKGTEDAVYDTEHGKKKQAKKEKDYAKWQRDKGAEDAQKSGHPWEHAKGSTREKEGKKSEKHAHIKDEKDWGESLDVNDKSLKGVTKKEVKNLQKAAVTGKGKFVKKADSLQDAYNSIYREDAQSDAVAQMSGAGGDPQSDAIKQLVKGEKKSKKGNAHAEMDRIRKTMASQKVKKEDKNWGYDKKGNSLNPVDIMKKKRKDDDLFGSPKKKVKEDFNQLISSGKFSKEEIERLAWIDFDESVEHRRNPEKYHDSEGHDKKLERDKPYGKRSRAARMADPDRGINSPAFKKFMADRGL